MSGQPTLMAAAGKAIGQRWDISDAHVAAELVATSDR
jgi:hypothetical protein